MRILVTGSEGFVGPHLLNELAVRGHEVLATTRFGDVPLDLPDGERCRALVGEFRPEAIVHLAALSSPSAAERAPAEARAVNVEGTADVIAATATCEPLPHLLFVSSSAVYGRPPPEEPPLAEDRPTEPVDVYGWTKLLAEGLLHLVPEAGGVPWTIARPFNHSGPGQTEDFVLSSFARQVARIEAGQQTPVLEVGNLDVERDFTDVRDIVRAYAALLEQPGERHTYNVCRGTPCVLRELLDALCARARTPVEVRVDRARLRPSDPHQMVGNGHALRVATGWEPRISLEQTLDDLLDYWRQRIAVA